MIKECKKERKTKDERMTEGKRERKKEGRKIKKKKVYWNESKQWRKKCLKELWNCKEKGDKNLKERMKEIWKRNEKCKTKKEKKNIQW